MPAGERAVDLGGAVRRDLDREPARSSSAFGLTCRRRRELGQRRRGARDLVRGTRTRTMPSSWRSSSIGPSRTSRPAAMIPTTSASCWTSARRWLDTKTVLPRRREVAQRLAHGHDAGRIEAVGGLVEEQQLRVAEERRRRCPVAASCPASSARPCRWPVPGGPTSSSSSSIRLVGVGAPAAAARAGSPGRRGTGRTPAARSARRRRTGAGGHPGRRACRAARSCRRRRGSGRSAGASWWSCRRRSARGSRRPPPSARSGRARSGRRASRTFF